MFELGNNLREARQRRRIDLVIAEQDTKIRSKYLAALETEEFDILPGPVFVRGFLRTYSRYLGLDPQQFVDEYNARFGRFEELDDQHHGAPALGRPGLAQERAERGRRTMRVVAVVLLGVLALLTWLGLREQPATTPASTPTVPATSTDPTATASPALGTAARTAGTAPVADGTAATAARGTARPTAKRTKTTAATR